MTSDAELVERATASYEPSPRRKPGETPMVYPREWKATMTIADDAPVGQKLWRTSSARGGTGGRPFIVGDLPEFIETESNSVPERAELITLPVTVNGQIAGERDLDYFKFQANAEEVITVDVAASRLGSILDPVVELLDSAGRRLAVDEIRVGSDPVLAARVPATGEYRILVSNLNFKGGPHYVYRLTVSTLPYVRFAFPPGGLIGSSGTVQLFRLGGNVPAWPEKVAFPDGGAREFTFVGTSPAMSSPLLETSDLPIAVEAEPNDGPTSATMAAKPAIIYGRLAVQADEDWYAFEALKDQTLTVDCSPFPRGSGSLPVVAVCDANGNALAMVSSAERLPGPCRLDWKAPSDGKYLIRVRDVRQGRADGADAPYRLKLLPTQADFALTATTDIANVVQGARGELELKIDRQGGFHEAIDLEVEGLPSGVRIEPAQIPAGLETFKIGFMADAEARPADSLVRIKGTTKAGTTRFVRALHLGHDAEGISLGSPTVDLVQLTVRHKQVFRLFCNEAYQYAHRGTIYPYLMEVERMEGFDGPITLEMADRQIKDLDGISIVNSTFAAGTSQLMLPLYLPENMHINVQAHSNVYAQGYVVFQDKWGQKQSMLQVSEMRCMIRPLPTVVKLRVAEKSLTLKPGGNSTCQLELDRTTNFTGELRVELVSPPAGVHMEPAVIGTNQASTICLISVDRECRLTSLSPLKLRGTGLLSNAVTVVTEATVSVAEPIDAEK